MQTADYLGNYILDFAILDGQATLAICPSTNLVWAATLQLRHMSTSSWGILTLLKGVENYLFGMEGHLRTPVYQALIRNLE